MKTPPSGGVFVVFVSTLACKLVLILNRVAGAAADELGVNGTPTPRHSDRGFTLVEILVVIAILGILSVVVAFSVRGVTDRGEMASCGADARTLTQAAEVYMAEESVDVLPAIGTSANRYEYFLIDVGFIKQVSTKYDLQADGTVVTNGQPCA